MLKRKRLFVLDWMVVERELYSVGTRNDALPFSKIISMSAVL